MRSTLSQEILNWKIAIDHQVFCLWSAVPGACPHVDLRSIQMESDLSGFLSNNLAKFTSCSPITIPVVAAPLIIQSSGMLFVVSFPSVLPMNNQLKFTNWLSAHLNTPPAVCGLNYDFKFHSALDSHYSHYSQAHTSYPLCSIRGTCHGLRHKNQ